MKTCPQCDTGYPDSHTTCPTHGVLLNEIRDLKPGMIVHHSYRIVRKLGQGGMGAVYLAQHTLMDEPRALKFLSPELSGDQAFTNRFLREVRTLRQVRNFNVVDCGDLERAEDGSLFFSMEFVDGPDLRGFLHTEPQPFDVLLALDIARGIAEGLGAAHRLGMVHRDIKPENILMTRQADSWAPKIADFGIVATKESSSIYTRTGGTLLTMAYAAPEQWRGTRAAELDGRTDLYALGGVLFEMLTGQTVFDAESYEGWAEQHRNTVPRAPSQLRPELAQWTGLDELVLHLLAKDRENRPADVAAFLERLRAVAFSQQSRKNTVREQTVPAPSPAPQPPPAPAPKTVSLEQTSEPAQANSNRSGTLVWGTLVLLLVLGIVGVAVWSANAKHDEQATAAAPEQTATPPAQQESPKPANPKPANRTPSATPSSPEESKPAAFSYNPPQAAAPEPVAAAPAAVAAPAAMSFHYDSGSGAFVRRMSGAVRDPQGFWNALLPLQPPPGAHGGYGLIGDDNLLGESDGYGLRQLGRVARRYATFDSIYVVQPSGWESIGVQAGTFTNVSQMNDATLGWAFFDLRDSFERDLKRFLNMGQ